LIVGVPAVAACDNNSSRQEKPEKPRLPNPRHKGVSFPVNHNFPPAVSSPRGSTALVALLFRCGTYVKSIANDVIIGKSFFHPDEIFGYKWSIVNI
jgi:hypothetical protein